MFSLVCLLKRTRHKHNTTAQLETLDKEKGEMDSDFGMVRELSELQKLRSHYQPQLPPCLEVCYSASIFFFSTDCLCYSIPVVLPTLLMRYLLISLRCLNWDCLEIPSFLRGDFYCLWMHVNVQEVDLTC